MYIKTKVLSDQLDGDMKRYVTVSYNKFSLSAAGLFLVFGIFSGTSYGHNLFGIGGDDGR